MKKILLVLFTVLLLNSVIFAQQSQSQSALLTIKGHIVLEKDTAGKAVFKVENDEVEILLAENNVLKELLKIENLHEKFFALEGEKIIAPDGVTEAFVMSSFKETVEEADHKNHKHDDHDDKKKDDHKTESHDGHNH